MTRPAPLSLADTLARLAALTARMERVRLLRTARALDTLAAMAPPKASP